MSQTKIESLTPEQEALIPAYREKWTAIALSTKPIDRQQASKVIRSIYTIIGKQEPEILFFDSPYALLNAFPSELESQLNDDSWDSVLNCEIGIAVRSSLYNQLENQLGIEASLQLDRHNEWWRLKEERSDRLNSQLWEEMYEQLASQFDVELWNEVFESSTGCSEGHPAYEAQLQLEQKLGLLDDFTIQPELFAAFDGFLFDFCISVLNCAHDFTTWELFQSLTEYCGWILPLETIALVCDRPIKLCFDSENRLHAEGEAAIQFVDGYSLYSYHGVTLPEEYGNIHPHQWRSQWLLEESNAELRRVLIQGIGYTRICQELKAIELDSWQEYTLLKIDNEVDVEPILLLKMTCPSTQFPHVLRVPSDVESAKEAIRWVNWGIAPEEFLAQT